MFPGQLCKLSICRQISSSSSTTCLLLYPVLYQVCHSFTSLSGVSNSGIDEAGWFQHYSAPKAPGQPPPAFTTDSFANRALFELFYFPPGRPSCCTSSPNTCLLQVNCPTIPYQDFKFTDVSNYALIPAMCSKTMTKINQGTKNIMTLCFTACITIKGKCNIQKSM